MLVILFSIITMSLHHKYIVISVSVYIIYNEWLLQNLIHYPCVYNCCLILRVIVGSNPKKFFLKLMETLENKVSEILQELNDCSVGDPKQCDNWVVILHESLEEYEDESGFVMISHSTLKQKTDDIFWHLDYLQR